MSASCDHDECVGIYRKICNPADEVLRQDDISLREAFYVSELRAIIHNEYPHTNGTCDRGQRLGNMAAAGKDHRRWRRKRLNKYLCSGLFVDDVLLLAKRHQIDGLTHRSFVQCRVTESALGFAVLTDQHLCADREFGRFRSHHEICDGNWCATFVRGHDLFGIDLIVHWAADRVDQKIHRPAADEAIFSSKLFIELVGAHLRGTATFQQLLGRKPDVTLYTAPSERSDAAAIISDEQFCARLLWSRSGGLNDRCYDYLTVIV